jgi:hypothetical protein
MSFSRRVLSLFIIPAVLLALADCRNVPTGQANAEDSGSSMSNRPHNFTLPEGTRLEVRLDNAVGSNLSRGGDGFHATLSAPIEANGQVIIPAGAEVAGRVVSARPSGHLQTPPELSLTLTSMNVGGQEYDILTSDRSWWGRSHKKHDAKWIGGLAGAGALIGALAGGGKGAAIGAGIGAGSGTGAAYATGKKDIYLPAETELRFVLRQPVTLSYSS